MPDEPEAEWLAWNADGTDGPPWDFCGTRADYEGRARLRSELEENTRYLEALFPTRTAFQEKVTHAFADLQEPLRHFSGHFITHARVRETRARTRLIKSSLRHLADLLDVLDNLDMRLEITWRNCDEIVAQLNELERGLVISARGMVPELPGHLVPHLLGAVVDDLPIPGASDDLPPHEETPTDLPGNMRPFPPTR